MSRVSGFRGTWQPNARPYVVMTPDVYVSLQGQTSVIACGECNRTINVNSYITGISTEASTDSPPGSATINLTVPDNDVNNFYVDGQLIITPMMEVEVYAKGYYLQGGFPQYYRIFWGLVSTITKDWSGGSTTVTLSCKDILRWWELTNVTINPAWLNSFGSSAGGYQLWQNQFAGMNPYTTIIQLAKESMGDFSSNNGSIAGSFLPEQGPESPSIGSYAKDIMTYWQYKFANIWNSLKIYGVSGQAYQFTGGGVTVSPVRLSQSIFENEQKLKTQNQASTLITVSPEEQSVFKKELVNAGNVEFTQNDIQSKLTVAMQARDQAGFEFFMDPSGDIVFKPPFYNLNVIPNKPISWINDFEIIDDSITDTETEVYTHITSQGIAFGGIGFDAGLTDEVTAPRTGVFDFHLMKLFGFRRMDYSTEWASDPRKLFFHLMDFLDRANAKRQNGTFTIPMRPELRLGFPVWVPYYDAFFYVSGISHQFSVGGQATTTLTVIAKRPKFIAPRNIGAVTAGRVASTTITNYNTSAGANKTVQAVQPTYQITFPDDAGSNSNLTLSSGDLNTDFNKPISIRDPKTGKLLGYPNVVMVFRNALNSSSVQKILQGFGSAKSKTPANKVPKQNTAVGVKFQYTTIQLDILQHLNDDQNGQLLQRLRAHRYEAAMTNAGAYDYAHDTTGDFIELGIIPVDSITWGAGTTSPNTPYDITGTLNTNPAQTSSQTPTQIASQINAANAAIVTAQKQVTATNQQVVTLQKQLAAANKGKGTTTTGNVSNIAPSATPSVQAQAASDALTTAQEAAAEARLTLITAQQNLNDLKAGIGAIKPLPSLDIVVRPVSDEFGFEVIGHYRYGRGAYIDRGQIMIALGPNSTTPGQVVNQLSTQFAATAGILSDPSTVQSGSGSALNFAAQFDQMQPEDFVTGASFRGVTSSKPAVDNIQFTSSTTYQSNMKMNTGHSIFIEADQARHAKTLAELTPTIDPNGTLAQAAVNCSCGLERAEWLTILPSDFVDQVLSNSGTSQYAPIGQPGTTSTLVGTPGDGFISTSTPQPAGVIATASNPANIIGTTGAIIGTATPASFFQVLAQFLSQQFDTQYKQGNATRELQDTGQSQGVVTQLFDADEQNNILGDPSDNPLFGPASLGDPNALKALQGQVNWGFGQTATALANAKAAFQNGAQQINQALSQPTPGGPLISATVSGGSSTTTVSGGGVTVTTPTPQVQPVTTQPVPNILQMILNPSTNTQLANAAYNAIPGSGGAPGSFPLYQAGFSGPPTKVGQD